MAEILIFSGDNRAKSLNELVQAYQDMTTEIKAISTNGVPSAPIHKVVLVHAERGLGKTRLVMELYRHLSENCDPDHYWPDNFEQMQDRVAVMPRAETCRYEPIIPFVWWGMQVPDNPNPGNTLFSSVSDLLPHLVTMRIAQRRSKNGRSALAELTDLGVDVGIEILDAGIDIAGETVGLGPIKRIGQSLFKIGKIVHSAAGSSNTPEEEGQKHAITVSDEVLKDLDRVLNPKSRHFSHRPAIIFIDDAQYADRDPSLVSFLEKLITQSKKNKWPVLLVFTHWSRQLSDHLDASGTHQPKSLVAKMLEKVLSCEENGSHFLQGSSDGFLKRQNYLELDLGEPVDNLSNAIRDQFPGLAASTVDLIEERSGGNPRKLEQIVENMKLEPSWFHDHSFEDDLTEEGLTELTALSRLPVDQMVYKRLLETPPETRKALALASAVGSSFVIDLIEKLAQNRPLENVRENLNTGESVYRFLKNVRDCSRNDIGYFSEILFFDAAKRYRPNAKAHFNDWPSDKEIFSTLDALLDEIVNTPELFENLNAEDLSHILNIAVDRMLVKQNEKAGLALAQLVSLESHRNNFEGAYSAAQKFIDGFKA